MRNDRRNLGGYDFRARHLSPRTYVGRDRGACHHQRFANGIYPDDGPLVSLGLK